MHHFLSPPKGRLPCCKLWDIFLQPSNLNCPKDPCPQGSVPQDPRHFEVRWRATLRLRATSLIRQKLFF